jgi:alpha-methylacyl-CoA racemase
MDEQKTGPLDGVRVLDLGHGMPAALATMIMADYGAEVIHVEPHADSLLRRTGGHSVWNRGKRSIAVDLDNPDERAIVLQLASEADGSG